LQAAPLVGDIEALAESARIPLTSAPVEAPAAAAPYGFTPREVEILGHVVAGRTYAEIARALVVSEKTVSAHISNMLRKTGAANRVDLANSPAASTRNRARRQPSAAAAARRRWPC
jgi:DNA-binding NarL/FixJ family response regulator